MKLIRKSDLGQSFVGSLVFCLVFKFDSKIDANNKDLILLFIASFLFFLFPLIIRNYFDFRKSRDKR